MFGVSVFVELSILAWIIRIYLVVRSVGLPFMKMLYILEVTVVSLSLLFKEVSPKYFPRNASKWDLLVHLHCKFTTVSYAYGPVVRKQGWRCTRCNR